MSKSKNTSTPPPRYGGKFGGIALSMQYHAEKQAHETSLVFAPLLVVFMTLLFVMSHMALGTASPLDLMLRSLLASPWHIFLSVAYVVGLGTVLFRVVKSVRFLRRPWTPRA